MSWCGCLPYEEALRRMESRRAAILTEGESPELILCEHAPVITCGRSSHQQNLLFSAEERRRRGIDLVEIARGGDLTYHGPGQLMIYPVVRVGVAVSAFLESVSQALGEVAAQYGVQGARWRREEPGLWLGERKLAACGLHISRGVSIHGWALNVCTPPSDWHCIVPCGLQGPGPISLAQALPRGATVPTVPEVAERLLPLLRRALRPYGLAQTGLDPAGLDPSVMDSLE